MLFCFVFNLIPTCSVRELRLWGHQSSSYRSPLTSTISSAPTPTQKTHSLVLVSILPTGRF